MEREYGFYWVKWAYWPDRDWRPAEWRRFSNKDCWLTLGTDIKCDDSVLIVGERISPPVIQPVVPDTGVSPSP